MNGPSKNQIRGLLHEIPEATAAELALLLAEEIDQLRETLAREIQNLQDQIDNHWEFFHSEDPE